MVKNINKKGYEEVNDKMNDLYKLFAYANVYRNDKGCLKQVNLAKLIQDVNPTKVEDIKEVFDAVDYGITWYRLKPYVVEDIILASKNLDDYNNKINTVYEDIVGEYPQKITALPQDTFSNPRLNIGLYSDSAVAETQAGEKTNKLNEIGRMFLWCITLLNNDKIRSLNWKSIAKKTRDMSRAGYFWDNIIIELAHATKLADINVASAGRKSKVKATTRYTTNDDGEREEITVLQRNERMKLLKDFQGSLFNTFNENKGFSPSEIKDLEYLKEQKKTKKNEAKEEVDKEEKEVALKNDIKKLKKEEDKKEEDKKEEVLDKEEEQISDNAKVYQNTEEYFGNDIDFILEFFNTSAKEQKRYDSFVKDIDKDKYNGEDTRSLNWHDIILASGVSRVDEFENLFYQIAENIRYLKKEKTEDICDLLKFFFTNFNNVRNSIDSYLESRAKSVSEFIVLGQELESNKKLRLDSDSLSEIIKKLLSRYSLTEAIAIAIVEGILPISPHFLIPAKTSEKRCSTSQSTSPSFFIILLSKR